jgi:lipopolysaccharide/colanic/teichoic acid biosynthesis glycosyltransferase
MKLYQHFLKRIIDITASFIGLTIISPFLVFFAFILFTVNHKKVLFLQTRPGLNGKLFNVIKFRTMTDKRDVNGNLLPDKDRLTSFGRFIRALSIDELPQLINVLKGDMSLVGPRPLLVEYLPLYSQEQAKRHSVRPGMTGWAQVNGRNTISWEQKFDYDIWYVENISLLLDIRILLLTVKKVLVMDGINTSASATMKQFKGSTK